MKRIVFFIIALSCSIASYSQLLQGEWRDHLPFHDFYRITSTNSMVFGSSVSGILVYNKSNGEIKKITKSTGIKDVLSDVEISNINYSEDNNLLVIGYTNGNIDLMKDDGTIVNLPDIKNKSIVGTKRINKIAFYNNYAYVACDFGIVKIDLSKMEFIGNYYFGPGGTFIQVNDIAFKDNVIYAATDNGIYWANLVNTNLLDFNYWNHIDFIPEDGSEYKFIENFNNQLFAVYNEESSGSDKLITITDNNYKEKVYSIDNTINDLSSSNGYLCFSSNNINTIVDSYENVYSHYKYGKTQHIFVDEDNKIYAAAIDSGMYNYDNNNHFVKIALNSPEYNMVSKIETKGDHLWVSSGSPNRKYFLSGLLYYYNNDNWTTYNDHDYPSYSYLAYANTYKIAIDPRDNNHVYVASEAYGLIEFLNGVAIRTFDRYNHSLFSDIPNDDYGLRVGGMQFDSQNNLWMVVNFLDQPIFKINADGTWERPSVTNNLLTDPILTFTDLLVTKDNDIWITVMRKGVVVLRDNGTEGLTEKSFPIKNSKFGTTFDKPLCLNEDHEGNIWIGTTTGPVIYYSPSKVFEYSDVSGFQVSLRRNDGTDNIDFLLSGETISDIKTDGGNRKWIATEKSGVFLVSADGAKTIYNFREENSPLLSNNVSGIGIMEKTGEVFFATDKGLVSFKGVATKGNSNYDSVYVFPNPVRQGFDGNITVTGLIENTIVKITDIGGNLVYETTSLGGQAIWDGRNFSKNRVGTGVYLVFLTTQDGSQSHITKILFIH